MSNNKAFTIIELLIVIVIIGVLVAIVAVGYNGVTNQANQVVTRSDIANIKKAVNIYSIKNNNRAPEVREEMEQSGLGNTMNRVRVFGGEQSPYSGGSTVKRGEYFLNYYNYPVGGYRLSITYYDYKEGVWVDYQYKVNERGEVNEERREDTLLDPVTNNAPCKANTLNECERAITG